MDATTLLRDILREGVDQFRRSEAGQFWRASKNNSVYRAPFCSDRSLQRHRDAEDVSEGQAALARAANKQPWARLAWISTDESSPNTDATSGAQVVKRSARPFHHGTLTG